MGKKTIYNIGNDRHLAGLPVMLLSLACGLFFSCTASVDEPEGLSASDRDGTTALDGQTSVRLVISAKDMSALYVTRTTDYDANAEEGEFMHTLCVFIVDNTTGKIEKKIQPDFTKGEDYSSDASSGNLPEYVTKVSDLSAGAKTIYAFSNWDDMDCDKWDALIAKEEGAVISDDDLAFAVDDPASKVDIAKGKYIPMSGKSKASITEGKAYTVTCGLDRLVSKVKLNVTGDADVDVPLETFTFTGMADKVDLFSDMASGEDISYNGMVSFVDEIDGTIPKSETTALPFYVNESKRSSSGLSDGFTIELATTSTQDYAKYDSVTYIATTAREDIPRNSIYPVSLRLDKYDFSVSLTAWATPIGVGMGDKALYYNDDRYDASYPYKILITDATIEFTIKPTLKDLDTEETVTDDISYIWEYTNEDEGEMSWNEETKTLTHTTLTAVPGYAYNFTVTVQWKITGESGTATHTRTFKLSVEMSASSFFYLT